jgi:pyruvate/2-oxoglutarate/acetoin dehydrogenase E1 component
MRKITYAKAINEAFFQVMENDDKVFQIGVGVNTPWYVGQTMTGLLDRFGPERMIDTPVSENAVMGMAVGSALAGMKPVVTFPRMDFMYYAMDQICNHAAPQNYMLGGNTPVPVTIRAIINRGGEQGAQHSQALHGMFMHIPGLKVVMPATAKDAKEMLIGAINDPNPVLYIEDRWIYGETDDVPEFIDETNISSAAVKQSGNDITIISASYYLSETLKVVTALKECGISAEVVDLRSISPLDSDTIIKSVKKTGKVMIIDGGWHTGGMASAVSMLIMEKAFKYLKKEVGYITLPDLPAPAAITLERAYYPVKEDIISKAKEMLN